MGGVHSGLEYDAADTASGGTYAMSYGGPDPELKGTDAADAMDIYGTTSELPTIVFHGTADTTVYPINGEQAIQTNDLASDGFDDGGVDTTAHRTYSGRGPSLDYSVSEYHDGNGNSLVEHWQVQGMDHAWSGGISGGEFTAPGGPDASRIIWEFVSGFTRGK